ncbi:recombinase family protein [Rhizobium sp. GN54]|uniref:recombinase family protein n=1 Tax=Rhizobium sp. GN54 TaxID=2898150 RepID=UPI001E4574E5|nr:recombinase family protein [Rhizobium sp. GN54]MCD2183657.1 recombinase family protein [Rhizobium sp. GN54]
MKPKAYSYVRMSTDIQLKGDSLRRQTEASAKYAEAHGLELIQDFKLEDIGVSAFHGRNVAQGALGKFLALAEDGSVPKGSYLLVESLDRISRQNPQAATTLFLQILQTGINIVTLTDGHVYRAGSSDFTDIIVSVVIMSRAYEESRTKSVRVGAAWEAKRRNLQAKKLTRVAPIWLKLNDNRTEFELVSGRVDLIKKIFNEADAGKGSFQIARGLNLAGVPTFSTSKGWHESYISKVLTNRAVLGEFQPHKYVDGRRTPFGAPVPDYFPAIVTREQFERIQAGRAVRRTKGSGRKGANFTNLFSGVAACGYCLGRMRVVDKGSGPKGGVYLRCENARRGVQCSSGSWPLAHFETSFLLFVEELDLATLLSENSLAEKRRSLEGSIALASAELAKQLLTRDRAFDLLADATAATAFVRAKIDEATLEINRLESALAESRSELWALGGDRGSSIEEVKCAIAALRASDFEKSASRGKITDWVQRNVRELLVYADGLDERNSRGGEISPRQFSVLFETGAFRTVQISGSDPSVPIYSVFADDDGWTLAEQGTQSRYL